jgi:hypothetical protein
VFSDWRWVAEMGGAPTIALVSRKRSSLRSANAIEATSAAI